MLELTNLNILLTFNYFTLSSNFKDFNKHIIGRWKIYENISSFIDEDRYVLLMADGEIGDCNIKPSGNKNNKWSFVEHCGRYMSTQNSFNISGLRTMEILYIDENIILAKSSGYRFTVFVKDSALSIFQTQDDIISFFSIKENYWLQKAIHLRSELVHKHDSLLNDSIILLGPGFAAPIIAALIRHWAQIDNLFLVVIIGFLVWLFLVLVFYLTLKLLRRKTINKYRKDHPNNKLAQLIPYTPLI